jgi:hypothetical protein
MTPQDKHLLKSRLTLAHVSAMNDWQRADLDTFNIPVPTCGPVDAPLAALCGRVFPDTLGDKTVHVDLTPADRFYCIVSGFGFSGVVRGWTEFDAVAPQGGKGVVTSRSGTRDHAERAWRRARYSGIASILPVPQDPPPPYAKPVASDYYS